MSESHPIPPQIWDALLAFLGQVRAGLWNSGGQIVLNVSPEGKVTSGECKGRVEPDKVR